MGVEHEAALGERAGLVAARHVDVAEVFHRRELPDDDLVAGQSASPARERDGDDDRKRLGSDPHGEGEGEEQRVERALAGQRILGEDERGEQEDEARQEAAEAGEPLLER
jgi:hypothetical protein